MMTLYFSRNPNPRLAVAVARYLAVPLRFEFAAPLAPDQREVFRPLNPNLTLPILLHEGGSLWEADAIACYLSRLAGANFWRTDDTEPEMIRWISWGKETFVRACDQVHFERGTKQRYRLGPVDPLKVEEGLAMFADAAPVLEAVLATRPWLGGDTPSYADFRMATYLPFTTVAGLPVSEFGAITLWLARLERIDAWMDPFAGLAAPSLPAIDLQSE